MICDDCGSEVIDTVCKNCGLVMIDRPIVALPPKMKDLKDYTSFSSVTTPDISVQTIHSKRTSNKELKRAFRIENRTGDKKKIIKATIGISQIKRISNSLKLPVSVLESAVTIFKQLLDTDFYKQHRLLEASYPAVVVIAAKLDMIPITFSDVAELSIEDIKKIKQAFKHIYFKLGLTISQPNLVDQVIRDTGNLGIFGERQLECRNIAEKVKNKVYQGALLHGYSAAIIYKVCDISRFEISEKLKISTITLYKRLGEIKRWINSKN